MANLVPTLLTAFKSIGQVFMAGGSAAGGGSALGTALAVGGTTVSALGELAAARNEKAVADYNAKQLEKEANSELAAAAQKAKNEERQGRLIMSRARAVSGASGGGPDINLLSSIEEESTYRTLLALWEGEERAAGRKAQAASTRFEGNARASARKWGAGSTLLAGYGKSLLDRYA